MIDYHRSKIMRYLEEAILCLALNLVEQDFMRLCYSIGLCINYVTRFLTRSMPASASKRRKLGPDQEYEEITAAEYEEDLDSILARIKQQEESEALARQLDAEWNNSVDVSKVSKGNDWQTDVIVIPDDGEEENDEEMARRLAREWGGQDSRIIPSQPESSSSRLVTPILTKMRPSSLPGLDAPPDEKLLEHRDLFTQERSCPKCFKVVESPRGLVCLRLCQPHSRTLHKHIFTQVTFSASIPPPTLL